MKRLLVLSALVLALSAQARVKYVAHGWDLLDATPEEVLANADAFDRTAVDGVTLMIRMTLPDGRKISHSRIMNDTLWPREALREKIAVFREIVKHPSLKESFISSWWQPQKRLDWTDDAAWATFAANMGTIAWLAHEGGLRGVLVDGEDYPRARQYDRLEGDPPYDEAAKLARRRGAQVFGEIFREFPDVTFLSFWLLSITSEYFTAYDPAGLARARGDLWPSFLNGMLDVLPPTAKFIDGNEHAYVYNAERNDFYRSACHQHKAALTLIAPENRDRYRLQLRAGFGLYIDSYIQPPTSTYHQPPLHDSVLARFRLNLAQATDAADEYVWLYGEKHPWVAWKNMRKSRFADKPTWEDRLPGFNTVIDAVKDPIAFVDRRYADGTTATNLVSNPSCTVSVAEGKGYLVGKLPPGYSSWQETEKKRRQGTFGVDASCGEGDAVSLCSEGVEKGCFMVKVKNVKPGEMYAVVASGLGHHVSGGVYWQKDGKWNFKLPSYALVFRPGDSTGWRRGRTLACVPDGVNELVLQLSVHLDSGERVHYDNVRVYRVD